jgi:polyisoprenyl-teichoic acid--peptidoglycan teichoic acid transferase
MWKIKNLSKKKKIVIGSVSAAIIVIGSILGVYSYIRHSYSKIVVAEPPEKIEDVYIPEEDKQIEEIDYGMEKDIVNVLLVGVDTRGEFEDSRTDSMIIATVNPIKGEVKLTSLMRDMYVQIPGRGYNRINAAFQFGGIELLKKTIKYNFGLSMDKYAAIDFRGFQDLIDMMGGIEIDIKSYEIKETNKYIKEVNGSNSTLLWGPGLQKLNGQQALSYSRIRKVGNNDYERTERQRRVLSVLLDKIKDTKVTSYPKLYSTLSSYIKTNIEFDAMLKLVYTVYKMGNFTTGSFRIPADGYFKSSSINGASVLVPNLKYNARELYKFIYNTVPANLVVPDNSKVYNATVVPPKEETDESMSADPQTPTTEKPGTGTGTGTGTGGTGGTGTGTGTGTGGSGGTGTGTGTGTGGTGGTGTGTGTGTGGTGGTGTGTGTGTGGTGGTGTGTGTGTGGTGTGTGTGGTGGTGTGTGTGTGGTGGTGTGTGTGSGGTVTTP